jgi:hypothetical protein
MQTNSDWSFKNVSLKNTAMAVSAAAIAFAVGALSGCSGNPPSGSPAYKEGELGNGDFLFVCDDGVACLPYAGAAKNFPKAIATGATFDVRFVAKNQQGADITINERRYEGIKAFAVGPYMGEGPEGFVALQPGYGTLMVRDSRNTVIDYVTLKILKPNSLVIYDANYDITRGKEPPRIQALNLKVDATSSYRVVAEYNRESIAGSIPVDWTSDDSSIVEIESYTNRVVNLRTKKIGKTTLTADAAGLKKTVDVEVK